jgi:hypothetical protein
METPLGCDSIHKHRSKLCKDFNDHCFQEHAPTLEHFSCFFIFMQLRPCTDPKGCPENYLHESIRFYIIEYHIISIQPNCPT